MRDADGWGLGAEFRVLQSFGGLGPDPLWMVKPYVRPVG
jgi:hypothetical protein